MESSIVFTYVVVAAASRAVAGAATAVVKAMLVLAVWIALLVTGTAMLCGRLAGAARRPVRVTSTSADSRGRRAHRRLLEGPPGMTAPLLRVENVRKHFALTKGILFTRTLGYIN